MAVKVLIKRTLPKSRAGDLLPLFRELRSSATNQPGYITGETLRRVDKPDEYLIISTWESAVKWKKWVASKERNEIQGRIDALLGVETEYEIYDYALT